MVNAIQRRAAVVVQNGDERFVPPPRRGAAAEARTDFLEPRHLAQWVDILARLIAAGEESRQPAL